MRDVDNMDDFEKRVNINIDGVRQVVRRMVTYGMERSDEHQDNASADILNIWKWFKDIGLSPPAITCKQVCPHSYSDSYMLNILKVRQPNYDVID